MTLRVILPPSSTTLTPPAPDQMLGLTCWLFGLVVPKSQNSGVSVRKQPYEVRVQPAGQTKDPTPSLPTGALSLPVAVLA